MSATWYASFGHLCVDPKSGFHCRCYLHYLWYIPDVEMTDVEKKDEGTDKKDDVKDKKDDVEDKKDDTKKDDDTKKKEPVEVVQEDEETKKNRLVDQLYKTAFLNGMQVIVICLIKFSVLWLLSTSSQVFKIH